MINYDHVTNNITADTGNVLVNGVVPGAGGGSGTVTSVSLTVPTGLSVTGSPITSSGTLAVTLSAGYAIPTTASQANWDTAYTDRATWSGSATGLTASTGRTSLGATTLGSNLFTVANPNAVTFPRFNADNTVSALDATSFRTAIGAGTSSTMGTVTSVSGTGTVSGLTLSGSVTSTGSLTLGGTLAVTASNFASQTANTLLAAPNGSSGVPTFRALVAADVPTLNQNTTGTAAAAQALKSATTTVNVDAAAAPTTGQVLTATSGTAATWQTPAAGGSVATDTIWDATGDLVYGTGSNTASRLALGTAGQVLKVNAGATAPEWGTAGGASSIVVSNKTTAYTVVAGDNGTVINCSGTFTVTLTAAATLGNGFNCWIVNSGTGSITIDPNGTETLDGSSASHVISRASPALRLLCDGTGFNAIALGGFGGSFGANGRSVQLGSAINGTGISCVAIGNGAAANGTKSVAIGDSASATNNYGTAIGANSGTQAAVAITGHGAMALGGSYASGTDSFAAAIGDNTSSYGAKGANSIAIGKQAKATGGGALAITADGNITTTGSIASALAAVAIGDGCQATTAGAYAFGATSLAAMQGKYAYASGRFAAVGDAQTGTAVLRAATTNATPAVCTSDQGAAGNTNQVILPNNSAYTVTGSIICRQSVAGADKASGWTFTAVIRRGANAASTTLVAAVVPVLIAQDATLATTVVAVTADTTNGGLAVTVTGIAATNLRWVCTVNTVECTYA